MQPNFPTPGDNQNATELIANVRQRYRSRPQLSWSDANGSHTVLLEHDGIAGSSPESAVIIAHRTVSRVHAELMIREDGLWVRDLQSRNGTSIGGVRVDGGLVSSDHTLRLGAVDIQVSYSPERRVPIEAWPTGSFGLLRGNSVSMRELYALLNLLSKSEAHAFIRGETGTGKELVARAIHDASSRRDKPFVVIDCGAFSDTLLDSELFGHAKGAFTGANSTHIGAFEAAEGGTIFLDEIGEVPISVQPKLLRVLETKRVRRVGEVGYRDINVRVISATHRDLQAMVVRGAFREDLYFRLSVLPAVVPPLRDRREDIPELLAYFATQEPAFAFDEPTIRELASWLWPGNVRELRNFVDRARALGIESALRSSNVTYDASRASTNLPPALECVVSAEATHADVALEERLSMLFRKPFRDFRDAWCEEGERRYLQSLFAVHNNDAVAVAKAAGIDKSYIYKIMRRLGLQA
jgi:two-component system, NtrC family, response regulator GlrR